MWRLRRASGQVVAIDVDGRHAKAAGAHWGDKRRVGREVGNLDGSVKKGKGMGKRGNHAQPARGQEEKEGCAAAWAAEGAVSTHGGRAEVKSGTDIDSMSCTERRSTSKREEGVVQGEDSMSVQNEGWSVRRQLRRRDGLRLHTAHATTAAQLFCQHCAGQRGNGAGARDGTTGAPTQRAGRGRRRAFAHHSCAQSQATASA